MPLDGLRICIVHISAALLGVGRWGRFSSNTVYTHLLAHLVSTHCVVLFYKVYSNTLNICLRWILSYVHSGQSLEDPALLFLVLWLLNASEVGTYIFPIQIRNHLRDCLIFRFVLLWHILVGHTKISFFEGLHSNPFMLTFVYCTKVVLTWYDFMSYYKVSPTAITNMIWYDITWV